MKTCPRCRRVKPLGDFASDATKSSGRMSHCRDCCNQARRNRYRAKLQHERQRSRDYYASHQEQKKAYRQAHPRDTEVARAYAREYWRKNRDRIVSKRSRPQYDPEKSRAIYMKRHGGLDEWARMMQEQDGLCYLCRESLKDTPQRFIHVDHDHNCCPGGQKTESCSACRRGLAHAWCNQIIGLCGEDTNLLRAIIANFEPVRDAAAERVAAKSVEQPQLMF